MHDFDLTTILQIGPWRQGVETLSITLHIIHGNLNMIAGFSTSYRFVVFVTEAFYILLTNSRRTVTLW